MVCKVNIVCFVILFFCGAGFALEPDEILVVANGDLAASVRLARYYCEQRGVPAGNVLYLSLGTKLSNRISRNDYDKSLAGPIRSALSARKGFDKIKCLVTTYGVPIVVGQQEPPRVLSISLAELRKIAAQEKEAIAQLEQKGLANSPEHKDRSLRLSQLQADIDRLSGNETQASVDSELSMVLFGPYELYRWQPNMLRKGLTSIGGPKTMMVSRLDGANYTIASGLIDKAIKAEKTGLKGVAYIDSRGMFGKDLYGYFDQSLRDLALLVKLRTNLPVKEETTGQLFGPGECPQTAIYCGWYSLRKYVDAFEFVDGAVGFHIASLEATGLHDPNSTAWCSAMLKDGITATLGAAAEPYLHSFPEPKLFFSELFDGACLVEAYYRTAPFNSWQLVLIGDPLYRPFKQH